MKTAKKRGVRIGAPVIMTDEVCKQIERRVMDGESVRTIAQSLNVTPTTIYSRYKKADLDELRMRGKMARQEAQENNVTPFRSARG